MRAIKTIALAIAALILPAAGAAAQVAPATASLTIDTARPGPRIEPAIFGQFTEHLGRGIYEGVWVGENSPIPNTNGYRNDVLAALRRIRVPVVRWPGGCFADEYHWRDGLGPRDKRPHRVNTFWGGVIEPILPEMNASAPSSSAKSMNSWVPKALLSITPPQ